ncbi:MAG TPA: SIR2 family protein [Acidimicrobiales bacterium]|nr:SIR2 family protein [Acidimicrobiales bacterium]
MTDDLLRHYRTVASEIAAGRVVPFLGAGVNLCGRIQTAGWRASQHPPSGVELTEHLARSFNYPRQPPTDLARVSQYAATMNGSGPLYEELRKVFNIDYRPTAVHRLLAQLPALLRARVTTPEYQLIVTTNYDNALEQAFQAAHEPFDVISYMADGEHRGQFLHYLPGDNPRLIHRPNEYTELRLDQRTVILKIHGAVDRASPDRDSYVITEDHYIDYLTRTDISNLVPVTLAAELRRSHFLFLGYSLRDWNLRVILHRIWGQQRLSYKSWAIQLDPDELEREYWIKRDVNILNVSLEEYVAGLNLQLQDLLMPGKEG